MWIIFNKILNLIFPEKCLGCGVGGTYLCPECRKKLPFPPLPENGIYAGTEYNTGLIKKAVRLLKYKGAKKIAKPLAELIYERINSNYGSLTSITSIIIPVPLSGRRLRQRGFNQAELIAKHLSEKMSVTMLNNVLYRTRHTISQVEIKNREKRLNNLKNAFSVKNADLIKNKTILLIDDVSTTGATLKEASKELKMAGARKVVGIVVAKG